MIRLVPNRSDHITLHSYANVMSQARLGQNLKYIMLS